MMIFVYLVAFEESIFVYSKDFKEIDGITIDAVKVSS